MARFQSQWNNFSQGIASDLRYDREVPKFARMWNFKQEQDRLIQSNGFRQIAPPGHVIEFSPVVPGLPGVDCEQWYKDQHTTIIVHEDCSYSLVGLDCDLDVFNFDMGEGTVDMSVVPVYYNGCIIKQLEDGTMVEHIINGVSRTMFDGKIFECNTQFLEHPYDDRLYVFSGCEVCYLNKNNISKQNGDVIGNSIGNQNYDQYRPITDWMQGGDKDGLQGTYTGFLGPYTAVLTQVAQLQNLLKAMGYYSGPIDGYYGPVTAQAVADFQANNFSKGQYSDVGGQNAGDPLVIDFIVGPETASALNCQLAIGAEEVCGIMYLPGPITAVAQYGAYIAIGTRDLNGNSTVFIWDRTLDEQGNGEIGNLTNIDLGQGTIQFMHVVDGRLIVVMSPASWSKCAAKYTELLVYGVSIFNEGFTGGSYLRGEAALLNKYCLCVTSDGEECTKDNTNYINRKTVVRGSKIYFTGKLNFQHCEDSPEDEGAMAGIFSIDSQGNLFFEATKSTEEDCFTYGCPISFGVLDSAFIMSDEDGTCVQDETVTDTVSGFITNIVDGNIPFVSKKIKKLYLHLNKTDELNRIEIWVREVNDVCEDDAGWVLAYNSENDSPVGLPTTEDKFNQCVEINRMDDGQPFYKMKEIQIMVKLFGRCAQVTNLLADIEFCDQSK